MPSSVIFDKHYDARTRRLTITFANGRIYIYESVPPTVAVEFDAAQSKGQYFNSHIRDSYRCREITPTRE
jgi:hypothetical protein